ncbi:CWF19-like protein 2 [Palaemon carinicauda]|uniref:CWF19-like protein 2 n=1 Tax=Palaemon carinicauda TaxID=392227 RepID=UPI0035B5FFDC
MRDINHALPRSATECHVAVSLDKNWHLWENDNFGYQKKKKKKKKKKKRKKKKKKKKKIEASDQPVKKATSSSQLGSNRILDNPTHTAHGTNPNSDKKQQIKEKTLLYDILQRIPRVVWRV